MKLLVGSDFHGLEKAYIDFCHHLREGDYDFGIIAGDLSTWTDNLRQQESSIKALITSLCDKPIYFIMGNDDGLLYDKPWNTFKNFINIHNNEVTLGEFKILGYHYTPLFMGGIFEKNEQDIEKDLLSIRVDDPEHFIFVSHVPAKHILDKGHDGKNYGSPSVADFVQKNNIQFHIAGHIHNSSGIAGFSVNASYPDSRMFYSIDTDSREIFEIPTKNKKTQHEVQIFGQQELADHIQKGGEIGTHLISIGNPSWKGILKEDNIIPDIFTTSFKKILRLEFYDVLKKSHLAHMRPRRIPLRKDVRRVIRFFRENRDKADGFAIHCWRGISRSTAIALGILYLIHGDEQIAVDELKRIRPEAGPHPGLVKYFDKILGCDLSSKNEQLREIRFREMKTWFLNEDDGEIEDLEPLEDED